MPKWAWKTASLQMVETPAAKYQKMIPDTVAIVPTETTWDNDIIAANTLDML